MSLQQTHVGLGPGGRTGAYDLI